MGIFLQSCHIDCTVAIHHLFFLPFYAYYGRFCAKERTLVPGGYANFPSLMPLVSRHVRLGRSLSMLVFLGYARCMQHERNPAPPGYGTNGPEAQAHPMYHAACKVEYQPLNRSYSQLMYCFLFESRVCESTFLEICFFKNCPEHNICGTFLKKRQKRTLSKVGFDQKLR